MVLAWFCPSREDQLRTFSSHSLLLLLKMMEKGRVRKFGPIAQTKALGTLTLRLMSLPKCYSNVLKVLPPISRSLFVCVRPVCCMAGRRVLPDSDLENKELILTKWSSRNWSNLNSSESVARRRRRERDLISSRQSIDRLRLT